MLKYLLLCLLAASRNINGRPAHSVPGDLASHILIVTPQAQVHLEPALKYDAVAPTTFVQHLSPLARIAAPHDETIIYVPSGAAVDAASVSVARSVPAIPDPLIQRKQETKQYEQISQQIEQAQAAIQQGSSAIGPQLSEAASAAANAASNAGSGLFPSLFPPAAAGGSSMKEEKLKTDKIDYEDLPTVPSAALLSGAVESRRFYALTPAVSHVIDFVHAPVFVGAVSTIRARNVAESENREPEKLTEIAPNIENLKSELPLTEFKKEEESKEPAAPAIEIPKIEADRIKDDRVLEKEHDRERDIEVRPVKIEEEKKYEEKKIEEKKFEEKKIDEKKYERKKIEEKKGEENELEQPQAPELIEQPQALEKQALEKEQPLQLIQQEQQPQIQDRKEQSTGEGRSEAIKEIVPQLQQKQLQTEKELQSQQQQQLQQQPIEPELKLQKEIQPQQNQEKLLNKPEEKELKEKSIEIMEDKIIEEPQPQPQQLLKESYKKESVQTAEPELNKISAQAPENEQLAQLPLQPQLSQRTASGRIEGADVVPVHGHPVHHEEPQQQVKSVVVPLDQAVVPVFVPQTKTV